MIKAILGGSFDGIENYADIIKVSSRGVDSGWLRKQASVSERIRDITPEPGKTHVHLIALGDTEAYSCFTGDTYVTNGNFQLQQIKDIKVGDKAFTHRGRMQEVTEVYSRDYSGDLYNLFTLGNYTPIKCTPNHKFLVIPGEQVACYIYPAKHNCTPATIQQCNFCSARECKVDKISYIPEWVRADGLAVGDYMLIPVSSGKVASWDVSEGLAYVAGLFAAEGSYEKSKTRGVDTAIRLSIHVDEVDIFTSRLQPVLDNIAGAPIKISVYTPGDGSKERTLRFSVPAITSFLRDNVGEYSHSKRLSKRIMSMPTAAKLAFISGYFDGDGHMAAADGRWTVRTTSLELACDVQYMIRSLGINATLCIAELEYVKDAADDTDTNNRESYNVAFCPKDTLDFSKWSYKYFTRVASQTKSWSFFWNGFYCVPIKDIQIEPFEGKVYNLEVGTDHSYVVGRQRVVAKNCNRNGDSFKKAANIAYHKTFETHAKFYRHHNNKNPDESYGTVKIAEYNPDMHRVELVIALDNNKCSEELDLLEKKGEFPVSMAASVPYDVCSICGHKATHRMPKFAGDTNAYCDHASKYLTKIAADGRQVYVDNTHPTFIDISRVYRPADRIAYTLEKVASDSVVSGAELAEELGLSSLIYTTSEADPAFHKKAALLDKLSGCERNLAWCNDTMQRAAGFSTVSETTLRKLAAYCTTQEKLAVVISELNNNKILLSPESFIKLCAYDKFKQIEPFMHNITACLPGIFTKVAASVNEFCSDASFDGNNSILPEHIRAEIRTLRSDSFSLESTQSRFVKNAARNKLVKTACVVDNQIGFKLASEYAKYQIGFLLKQSEAEQDFLTYLTLASNYVL